MTLQPPYKISFLITCKSTPTYLRLKWGLYSELAESLGTENIKLKESVKANEVQLNRLGELEKVEGLFAKYIAPKVYGHEVAQVQDGVETKDQSVLFAKTLALTKNIDTLSSRWQSILANLPKETTSQKNADNPKYNFTFGN